MWVMAKKMSSGVVKVYVFSVDMAWMMALVRDCDLDALGREDESLFLEVAVAVMTLLGGFDGVDVDEAATGRGDPDRAVFLVDTGILVRSRDSSCRAPFLSRDTRWEPSSCIGSSSSVSTNVVEVTVGGSARDNL